VRKNELRSKLNSTAIKLGRVAGADHLRGGGFSTTGIGILSFGAVGWFGGVTRRRSSDADRLGADDAGGNCPVYKARFVVDYGDSHVETAAEASGKLLA